MQRRRRLVIVQHVAVEGPGRLLPLAQQRDFEIVRVPPILDDTSRLDPALFADVDDIAGLVVLGGPMGIGDLPRLPRLRDELALIAALRVRDRPILGICLGSQLLAHAAGADVVSGPALELGWHPVTTTAAAQHDPLLQALSPSSTVLHWHGDIIVPRPTTAMTVLASSAQTAVQAFVVDGNAWGLLFHLEAGIDEVTAMAAAFPDDIARAGTTTQQLSDDSVQYATTSSALATQVFGAFLDRVER